MAALPTIGFEFVAAGVQAFQNAGRIVVETVADINEHLSGTPQKIQATSVALDGTLTTSLSKLEDQLKTLQTSYVNSVLSGSKPDRAIVNMIAETSTAIRILKSDIADEDRANQEAAKNAANFARSLGTDFEEAGRKATGSVEQINERIKQLTQRLQDLRKLQAINIIATGQADPNIGAGISTATQQLTLLQQAQQANLNSGLEGFISNLTSVFTGGSGAVGGFVSGLLSFVAISTAVITAAAGIATAIGNVVVGFAALKSIEFAAGIEKELKFGQAVLQATDAQMAQLEQGAERLASAFPISFRTVIESLTEAGRAGIHLDELTGHVGVLIQSLTILGKGEIGPRQIAESLAASEVAFKNVGGTADDFAKTVVGVANATRLSIPEVVSGFNKLAPIASLLHVTEQEVGAFIGVVGAAGLRGEEAGTGLRNFFLRLTKEAPEAQAVAERFGISLFDAAGKARPLGDVLANLEAKFGDGAIAAGKMDDRTRLFALTSIFQTRSATAAALAIVQGTEAFNALLDVIDNTDPIKQSAQAIDNLQDKITIARNKVGILANAFGQELLPGLKAAVNTIDQALSGAVDPNGQIRQRIQAVGQAINAVATGQGTGQAQFNVGAAFGQQGEDFFRGVEGQAEEFRALLEGPVTQSVTDLIAALGHLLLGSIFDPSAPEAFGQVLLGIVQIIVGVINAFTLMVTSIDNNRDAVANFGRATVAVMAAVLGAIGSVANGLLELIGTFGRSIEAAAQFQDSLQSTPGVKDFLGSQLSNTDDLHKIANNLIIISQSGLAVGTSFAKSKADIDQFAASLTNIGTRREAVAKLSKDIAEVNKLLEERQKAQLNPDKTAPDVSDQITFLTQTRDALEQLRQETDAGTITQAQANSLLDQANQAYSKLRTALGLTEGDTTSLSAELKEQQRVQAAIKSETESLTRTYEEMSRSSSKAIREIGDKLDDLETKTNREMQKLLTDTVERVIEIERKLQEANEDAQTAFDFNKVIQNETQAVNRLSQDLNTLTSRNFQFLNTALQHSIEDRDTVRQRDFQHEETIQQRILDLNIETHNRINEDLQTSLQQADEDRARAFQRAQDQQLEQLQRGLDAENLRRNRTLDDAERQKQLARDLSRAQGQAERQRIQQSFQDETENLKDRRAREDSETKIRLQQEEQIKQARQKSEDETLANTRRTAAAELAIRRLFIDEERAYRERQEDAALLRRFQREDQFRTQTRVLNQQDTRDQQRLQDQQTTAERQIQDQVIKPQTDAIAQQQFDEQERLRRVQATRQENELAAAAQRRANDINERASEQRDQIVRDGFQAIQDMVGRADQIVLDAQRKVGGSFPGLEQFLGGTSSLFGNANAAINAVASGRPGTVPVPDFAGAIADARSLAGAQGLGSTNPALLSAAASIKASNSTIELNQNVLRLLNVIEQQQNTQAGGGSTQVGQALVNIDDFQNNGIIIDDGSGSAINRLAQGLGNGLAQIIRPKAGGAG